MYDAMRVIYCLWNVTKRLFNKDHEVTFWTKAGDAWVRVGLNMTPPADALTKQWVCEIKSPAGAIRGQGDSIEEAYNDCIKGIQRT